MCASKLFPLLIIFPFLSLLINSCRDNSTDTIQKVNELQFSKIVVDAGNIDIMIHTEGWSTNDGRSSSYSGDNTVQWIFQKSIKNSDSSISIIYNNELIIKDSIKTSGVYLGIQKREVHVQFNANFTQIDTLLISYYYDYCDSPYKYSSSSQYRSGFRLVNLPYTINTDNTINISLTGNLIMSYLLNIYLESHSSSTSSPFNSSSSNSYYKGVVNVPDSAYIKIDFLK